MVDQNGEGRWIGSAGHEDTLKMTDIKDIFEDEDDGGDGDGDDDQELGAPALTDEGNRPNKIDSDDEDQARSNGIPEAPEGDESQDSDSGPKERKRKRKGERDPLAGKKKKGRNEIDAEPSFFSGL